MNTDNKSYAPIVDLEAIDFYRVGDYLDGAPVSWIDYPSLDVYGRIVRVIDHLQTFSLFSFLYRGVLAVAKNYSRGDRIDISASGNYYTASSAHAAKLLEDLGPKWGVQFVCFTKSGAAFVKL